jgi:hypothetical protein
MVDVHEARMNAPVSFTAQLVILADPSGRKTTRRLVNFAASVRSLGAIANKIRVTDLSPRGFKISCERRLEPDTEVWLKITGLNAVRARIVWCEGEEAGCEFFTPLRADILNELISGRQQGHRKALFGARPS